MLKCGRSGGCCLGGREGFANGKDDGELMVGT